ncbi:zinc-binding alcohol dehydrogenase family protein [Dyadobacter sp. CY261]|uniref:quinone oxidoreductase family protein n=1 Tax=Dyadobacter sp. CY261 TaxID=2907203 RepID=UPI001F3851B4|nr:zinc-binding alcohol dehydrogenase family protein [Dyadobacter sp. CY261]MCF0069283.1 zinc-binding alcohol dehydrogenase family protein [Dyadobacter sp. CY261]
MKAAILNQFGASPVYGDFPEPAPSKGQQLIRVKAASVKNIDKGVASGAHYSSHGQLPVVMGVDGVGMLENGQRVYAGGGSGMMAEFATIPARYVAVPDAIDDVTAAALPNPALSAWFSLVSRAGIQPGDTVYVNGATGVTGKVAIQLARHLGAGRIIAAGRNEHILKSVLELGADEVVVLKEEEDKLAKRIADLHEASPFDIVIDYTWGKPAEMLLNALAGNDLHAEAHRTRYVTVGEMAGPTIQLPSAFLRSSAIELYGVGGGSISKEVMQRVPGEILPMLFSLAAEGKLRIDTIVMPLQDVAKAWTLQTPGKRIVLVP